TYSFFFQAEDGIRDFHVTGVQTCALPIFWHVSSSRSSLSGPLPRRNGCLFATVPCATGFRRAAMAQRSHRGCWWEGASGQPVLQIGRASCRERAEVSGGAVYV